LNQARNIFDNQSTMHLGLVMFLMTILLHHGTRRILDFGLVTQCFRDAVENATEAQNDNISLWLLVMGGIWTSHHPLSDWLEARIKIVSERVRISTWQEARAAMQKLPWITVLHDQPGEAFWNTIHSGTG
jgi:hypothetical protein